MSSLRDALTSALDAHTAADAPLDTTQAPDAATPGADSQPSPAPASLSPVAAPAAAEPDGRARDTDGRFVRALGGAPATRPPVAAPTAAPAAAAAPVVEFPKLPSTWKRELADHWPKLDRAVAEEILRREADYAKGVSTYKKEWDNAAPILEALAPYQPMLQQSGIAPAQWIGSLAEAQKVLAFGSPEQKLAMLRNVAQQYAIPLQNMFTQTQQGGWAFNEQAMTPRPLGTDDIRRLVQEESLNTWAHSATKEFSEARDAAGNPLHPHFGEVRGTMTGLLQAGLATDLKGAYSAALRMPAHSALFDADQKSLADARARDDAAARTAAAVAARARTVSVKGTTPPPATSGSATKGLRAQLTEAFDDAVGQGARV